MRQYEIFELRLQGKKPGNSAQPNLTVCFSNEKEQVKVKGFYEGNGKYKVRFLPLHSGIYEWKVESGFSAHGTVNCEKADEKKHGPVRVSGTHFCYEDGTPYIPVGTTIYAMAHQPEELIDKTFQTLSQTCFNKVRLCLFPKSYEYNENEPEYFPFERKGDGWDVTKPVKAYWDNMENVVRRLDEMNIQADIILFHSYDRWGFSNLTTRECMIYLDTVIRHLAAFPNIWWSLANEYDLMFGRTIGDWKKFGSFLQKNDPYGHLRSNHNAFRIYDDKHMTHICIQSTHTERAKLYLKKYKKPVIFDECAYEGNIPQSWGCITGQELVNRFWMAAASGAYCSHGETFLDENEILWWSKGGTLKGESEPRIAWLKQILEELKETLDYYELPLTTESLQKVEKKGGIVRRLALEKSKLRFYSYFLKESTFFQLAEIDNCKMAHIGERVYLLYFGRSCPGEVTFALPENRAYSVEVMDTWQMTRQQMMEKVNGRITIPLPSKEGIAVLIREE